MPVNNVTNMPVGTPWEEFIEAINNDSTKLSTFVTGLQLSTLGVTLGSNVAAWLATPSSANLRAALTDESGSSSLVFATSPTLVTPILGAATATSINKVSITAPATSATLVIADGKTFTVNQTLTLTGTAGTTMTFPATSATIARTDAANTFTGHQTIEGITSTGATGTGQFVFDTSPTLITPNIGVATATTVNKLTLTAPATGATLTLTDNKTVAFTKTLTFGGTDGTTMTFPSTSATVARTDAANTFTGTQTVGALIATTVNGNTVTSGTGVLTLGTGKTTTFNSTSTFTGTDAQTYTFPTTSATLARTDAANTFTGTQTVGAVSASDDLTFTVASKGSIFKQGANGRVGTFVANGATPVTVSNTSVATTDAIVISLNTVGGTVGVQPHVATITAATGFTVVCTASDTSTYNYALIKNAA